VLLKLIPGLDKKVSGITIYYHHQKEADGCPVDSHLSEPKWEI
jgi:hypothetical protein